MVPQQNDTSRSNSPTVTGLSVGLPMFGSLLVDKNSSTPYSDATQVSEMSICFFYFLFVCRAVRVVNVLIYCVDRV